MCYSPNSTPFVLVSALFLVNLGWAQQPGTNAPAPPRPPSTAAAPGQATSPAATAQKPSAPKEDPRGTKALQQAIERLKERSSVDATIWEETNVGGSRLTLRGRILTAPGRKFRSELGFEQGPMAAQRIAISDGRTLWQVEKSGESVLLASRIELKRVRDALNQPDVPKETAELFYERHGFFGPRALLEKVRDLMMVTAFKEGIEYQGHKVNRLTAIWSRTVQQKLAGAAMLWMRAGAFGQLEVLLDPATGWPYRFDWYTQTPAGIMRTVRIEFRDPKFSPASPAALQKDFTFDARAVELKITRGLPSLRFKGFPGHWPRKTRPRNERFALEPKPGVARFDPTSSRRPAGPRPSRLPPSW